MLIGRLEIALLQRPIEIRREAAVNIGSRAPGDDRTGRNTSAPGLGHGRQTMARTSRWAALVAMVLPATGMSADPKRYLEFEPEELRAVEARLSELIEPGTDRLVREPETAIERYVVERQLRLYREFASAPVETHLADGTIVLRHPATTTSATRLYTNADGLPVLECAHVDASTLGFAPHLLKRRLGGPLAR